MKNELVKTTDYSINVVGFVYTCKGLTSKTSSCAKQVSFHRRNKEFVSSNMHDLYSVNFVDRFNFSHSLAVFNAVLITP